MRNCVYLCFLFLSLGVTAKEHRVSTPGGTIVFITDEAQNSQRNFYGADLWFTGEERGGRRNVMSVVYNSSNLKLETGVDPNEFKAFKQEMELFAKSRNYSGLRFEPYAYKELNSGLAYHRLAWSYLKEGERFAEQSYYVECENIFFIAKATTFHDSIDDQEKFKKIIEKARCGK